eukprot:s142_g24.t1
MPAFSREPKIAMGAAGLQPRASDHSGHCRTSAASARSQRTLPDFSREHQIAGGTAGLQPNVKSICSAHGDLELADEVRRAHCDLLLADEARHCPLRSGADEEETEEEEEEEEKDSACKI